MKLMMQARLMNCVRLYQEGMTALMMGCQNNHVDVVKALVAANALVDAENSQV